MKQSYFFLLCIFLSSYVGYSSSDGNERVRLQCTQKLTNIRLHQEHTYLNVVFLGYILLGKIFRRFGNYESIEIPKIYQY